jgi:hypothetical protein
MDPASYREVKKIADETGFSVSKVIEMAYRAGRPLAFGHLRSLKEGK